MSTGRRSVNNGSQPTVGTPTSSADFLHNGTRMSPESGWDTEADLARMVAPRQPAGGRGRSSLTLNGGLGGNGNAAPGFTASLDFASSNSISNDTPPQPRVLRQSSSTGTTIASLTSPRGNQSSPQLGQQRISGLASPNSMAHALRGAALSAAATGASTVAARGALSGAGLVTASNTTSLIGAGPLGPSSQSTTRHFRANSEDGHAPNKLKVPSYHEHLRLLRIVEKGDTFIKHGRKGAPHSRLVQVKDRKLLWSGRFGAPGSVPLHKVVSILRGKQTVVFERKLADDVPDYLCLSVVLEDRTVDLQAGSQEQRDLWIRALREAVKLARGGGAPPKLSLYEMARLDPQHYRNVLPPSATVANGSNGSNSINGEPLVYPLSPAGGKHGLNLSRLVPGPSGSIIPSQKNEYAVGPIPEYRGTSTHGNNESKKAELVIERVSAPPSAFTSALSAQLRAAAILPSPAAAPPSSSSASDDQTATALGNKRASLIATAAAIAAAPPATSIPPAVTTDINTPATTTGSNDTSNPPPPVAATIIRSASGSVSHKRSMSLMANFSPHLQPNLSIYTGATPESPSVPLSVATTTAGISPLMVSAPAPGSGERAPPPLPLVVDQSVVATLLRAPSTESQPSDEVLRRLSLADTIGLGIRSPRNAQNGNAPGFAPNSSPPSHTVRVHQRGQSMSHVGPVLVHASDSPQQLRPRLSSRASMNLGTSNGSNNSGSPNPSSLHRKLSTSSTGSNDGNVPDLRSPRNGVAPPTIFGHAGGARRSIIGTGVAALQSPLTNGAFGPPPVPLTPVNLGSPVTSAMLADPDSPSQFESSRERVSSRASFSGARGLQGVSLINTSSYLTSVPERSAYQ